MKFADEEGPYNNIVKDSSCKDTQCNIELFTSEDNDQWSNPSESKLQGPIIEKLVSPSVIGINILEKERESQNKKSLPISEMITTRDYFKTSSYKSRDPKRKLYNFREPTKIANI